MWALNLDKIGRIQGCLSLEKKLFSFPITTIEKLRIPSLVNIGNK